MSDQAPAKKDIAPSWRIKEWFPNLDEATHELLNKYFHELIKFNKTINLISPKTLPQADAIHFADCILASEIVHKKVNKNDMLYDVGSGNGFPGIIYAILYPEQRITLLDSDERKCEFLKHVVQQLSLKNVSVSAINIETLSPETISQAICRGFAPLPKALLSLRKIVKKGGLVFHLKSEEWAIEVSQIPIQLCSFWRPNLLGEYVLPVGNKIKMYVVETLKLE